MGRINIEFSHFTKIAFYLARSISTGTRSPLTETSKKIPSASKDVYRMFCVKFSISLLRSPECSGILKPWEHNEKARERRERDLKAMKTERKNELNQLGGMTVIYYRDIAPSIILLSSYRQVQT